MLFLPISFLILLAAANPQQKQVEKVLQTHIQTVAGKNHMAELYASSFRSFLADEKTIFKDCASQTCQVKIQSEKMPHKANLWKARAEVHLKTKGKTSKLSQRSGCYFIENKKIVSYMEDCEGR